MRLTVKRVILWALLLLLVFFLISVAMNWDTIQRMFLGGKKVYEKRQVFVDRGERVSLDLACGARSQANSPKGSAPKTKSKRARIKGTRGSRMPSLSTGPGGSLTLGEATGRSPRRPARRALSAR